MEKHKNIFINYIKKFGDKYCCFEDLIPYFDMLNSDELLDSFKTEMNSLIKTVRNILFLIIKFLKYIKIILNL